MKLPTLTASHIHKELTRLPGWHYIQLPSEHLYKKYTFYSFTHGASFVKKIAVVADALNHHPDIELTYSFVTIKLATHDAGGITQLDLDLASTIDHLTHNDELTDTTCSLALLREATEQFVVEREWVQFHSLKNLAAAISVEAGELLEHFIWKEKVEELTMSVELKKDIAFELVDILLALLAFANRLDIDITTTFYAKLQLNKEKYPIEKARGKSDKYTSYSNT